MASVTPCKCRKWAIDPCCERHGIGASRYLLNLVGMVAVVFVLMVAIFTAAADARNRPSWLPAHWWRLAKCETGLRWRWNSGSYEGAFGIYYGTWDTYRKVHEPRAAYLASPRVQLRVARRIAERHTMYAWGCWRHGWVRG